MSASSKKPSSRVSSLAKRFDPNVLQSQGTTDGEEVDVLSQKIDKFLIIQNIVLQKLDKVFQKVDEIENDIKKVKAEKARPSLTSEIEERKCTSEMKKLCLDMSSALSEIRIYAEHQSKRLDGMEQIVMGIQLLLSLLGKKMKSSKALKLLFKSQGTPRSGIKNGNLKNDKNKTSFRMQSFPQKEDVLVKRENGKVIKDQKAKDKNEKPCLEFKETKTLMKKKPPDSIVQSIQKNQSSSHKERVLKLNKENAGNVNTLLTHSNTPKGYAQVQNEDKVTASENPTELHPAAAPDVIKDICYRQQSYKDEKVHQKIVVQGAGKNQQALGSDKSHSKEEVIEEEGEEDETEEETVEEEESESTLETEEEVQGDVDPHKGQDQAITAWSSSSDGPEKELKVSKTITEEFNKTSTQLLQKYDDSKEQGGSQNCYESSISSKRRVTEEYLVKDDSKKSRVETEAAKDVVKNKTEKACLISKDAPKVPEPSIDDKKPQIIIDISPAPPAPFRHRIVSAKHAQVNTFYTVSKTNVLGGGRFGQVHQCVEKASGLTLAAKIIKARGLKEKEEVKNEIYVMNQLNHVNLLQLYDAFESKNDIVLIMEYVAGGELFDRIISENYNLTELDTILFIKQICEGIQYMHQMYFLHLDLKIQAQRKTESKLWHA
ncbi:myosin light chain kinase family member 4 isoform X2 [Microcaecilia unicolor]|uniref:Myosin light chain kinase family member 4 isoform X2 n=1 Tax=Microcaecilia unicolor TaxID=1415580 RepID=A0A6P7YQ11_9AMPH|nr:myosin light chain kinase family member 4 isoform X2 [Microcaecilia unicolor]